MVPNCPAHIQGEARNEWRRISGELVRLNLVARIDKAALALYCQLWQRWIEAENAVRELGLVVTASQLRAYLKVKTDGQTENLPDSEQKTSIAPINTFLFEGMTEEQPARDYPGKNPYLSIAESCMDRMKQILVEFGMTPSSRARVKAMPVETTDEIEDALQAGSDDETERAHLQ
jgi:P27 family predicted phage terminase small subunit